MKSARQKYNLSSEYRAVSESSVTSVSPSSLLFIHHNTTQISAFDATQYLFGCQPATTGIQTTFRDTSNTTVPEIFKDSFIYEYQREKVEIV